MKAHVFIGLLLDNLRFRKLYSPENKPVEFVDREGNIYVFDEKFSYDGHVNYIHIKHVANTEGLM